MSLHPIAPPPSLAQSVATQIRDAIVSGSLKLGENISEDRLVAQLGVSRTPVRDAMAILQAEGLVKVRPKRGSFVFETSLEDIEALGEFRLTLETAAITAAHLGPRAAYLTALSRSCQAAEAALLAQDKIAFSQHDGTFHRHAFTFAANPYLSDAQSRVAGRIAAIRANISRPYAGRRRQSQDEHRAMLAALEKDRLPEALEILKTHIQNTALIYREALEDGHLSGKTP